MILISRNATIRAIEIEFVYSWASWLSAYHSRRKFYLYTDTDIYCRPQFGPAINTLKQNRFILKKNADIKAPSQTVRLKF